MTEAVGCFVAKSMAQIPVPVPISRTWLGEGLMGAKCSFSESVISQSWCCISRRSCSISSFGMTYLPSLYLWYVRPFSSTNSYTLERTEVVELRLDVPPMAESSSLLSTYRMCQYCPPCFKTCSYAYMLLLFLSFHFYAVQILPTFVRRYAISICDEGINC